MDEAVDLVEPKIDQDLLEVETAANPTVRGSLGGVTQVIVNLLLNAYDAIADTPGAGITVRVTESDDTGVVEVADEGEGIDPEVLDEIFEPFTSTKGNADE
ncbi:MAG: ATP-binding protein, partial [Bradymonadaceae bacterium]